MRFADEKILYSVIDEVADEVKFAVEKFPPMRSAHEGYAIIHEETDELWDAVKGNKADGSLEAQRKEAIQVAAMAIRFVLDISDKGKHRNERTELPKFSPSVEGIRLTTNGLYLEDDEENSI